MTFTLRSKGFRQNNDVFEYYKKCAKYAGSQCFTKLYLGMSLLPCSLRLVTVVHAYL